MQPKALAHLLEPFGIQPRNHRTGPDTVVKGYYQEDLEPIWTRHLLQTCGHLPQQCGTAAPGCGEGSELAAASDVAANVQNSVPNDPKSAARSQKPAANPVAANLQNLSPAISGQQPQASSQQLTRPMWGADWTPPPTPFAAT